MNGDIGNNSMDTPSIIDIERRNSDPVVDQSFVLQNPTYGNEALSKLNAFRAELAFTDAILCVGDKEFPCHRNVLAVSSPYFKAMFSSDLRESRQIRIPIKDIACKTMQNVIDYAYTGKVEITVDNAQELLAAANLFQYPTIVEACCDFLARHLHPSNCLGIEKFAQLHSCKKLERLSNHFTLDNFSAVVEYDEFNDLSQERLISYLSSDLIDVRTEETVYDAVMKWVHHKLDSRRKCLSTVLEHVRLATVDVHYLEEIIEKDPLIQSEEQCRVLVEDAKKYHETKTEHHGQRRRSMQTETIQPRPSTVAKEVIVVVGGINSSLHHVLQSVEMYDPHKDKWHALPDIPCKVSFFSVSAANNEIFLCGGIVDGQLVADVWKFESVQRKWSKVKPMLSPRARHCSTAWEDKLYVLGGVKLSEGNKLLSVETVECYNVEEDEWTVVGQSPMPRERSHAVPFEKTIVEIGGTQGGVRVQTMESYFCSDTKVIYSGEQFILPETIQYAQISVLNGIFYIIWEDTKRMVSINPERRTLRRLPDMHYAHTHSGSCVLNDKIIYVAGGLVDSKPSRVIECFDCTTNCWTIVKSMRQARACHGCVTIQMS